MSDERKRLYVAYLKEQFLKWRDPPIELPPDSTISDVVDHIVDGESAARDAANTRAAMLQAALLVPHDARCIGLCSCGAARLHRFADEHFSATADNPIARELAALRWLEQACRSYSEHWLAVHRSIDEAVAAVDAARSVKP